MRLLLDISVVRAACLEKHSGHPHLMLGFKVRNAEFAKSDVMHYFQISLEFMKGAFEVRCERRNVTLSIPRFGTGASADRLSLHPLHALSNPYKDANHLFESVG